MKKSPLFEQIAQTVQSLDDAGPAALNCLAMRCRENVDDFRLPATRRRIWRMLAALAKRLENS